MSALAAWAVALLIGAAAFPIAARLLRRMPDAGAGVAIPLGMLLAGYAYFILRVASVLPMGRGGYVLVVAMLAICGVVVGVRDRRLGSTLRRSAPAIVTLAGLFTLLFFGYVSFRSYTPEIEGTEQPMDLMYLNATLTSPTYPPHDPWLAGEKASYYYFGYVQVGLLASVASVPASTGYNLGLAYTFAATGTAIASLAYALARWALGSRSRKLTLAAAGLSVVLLLGVGSLSAPFEWAAAHGNTNRGLYEAFDVEWMIPCTEAQRADPLADCYRGAVNPRTSEWYPTEFWFWWRGSRIIPSTITEFPFFSFLLGDLHPHLMALPLALLALSLAGATWRGRGALGLAALRRDPAPGALLALVFGGLAFMNAWDLLTFSAVLGLAVLARNARASRALDGLRDTAGYLAPIGAVAVAAYLPWYLTFSSQASGFHAYVGEGTLPSHALLQFGPLLAAAVLALAWAWRGSRAAKRADAVLTALWAPLLPLLAWLLLAWYEGALTDAVTKRGGGGWTTLIGYGAITALLAASAILLARRRAAAAPLAALATLGVLLLYGAELFYIGDIFADATPRLNTVFKLSYQAWLLLAVAGGPVLLIALQAARRHRAYGGWLAAPALVLAAAGLIYPLLALPNRTDNFDSAENGLDGLAGLARRDPPQYALTRWMQDHSDPGATIVEASGRQWSRGPDGQPVIVNGPPIDYGEASLVSARSGRQTVIGWYFHELQWRGTSEAKRTAYTRRQDLADSVYLAREPEQALRAMREANARYVVVGSIELQRFPEGLLANFDAFLDLAFEAGNVRVYEMPRYEVVDTS